MHYWDLVTDDSRYGLFDSGFGAVGETYFSAPALYSYAFFFSLLLLVIAVRFFRGKDEKRKKVAKLLGGISLGLLLIPLALTAAHPFFWRTAVMQSISHNPNSWMLAAIPGGLAAILLIPAFIYFYKSLDGDTKVWFGFTLFSGAIVFIAIPLFLGLLPIGVVLLVGYVIMFIVISLSGGDPPGKVFTASDGESITIFRDR